MTVRTLVIYEDYMGHRTHGRFLTQHLSVDRRFEATIIALPSIMRPKYPTEFLKPKIPGLHRYGLDFWGLRQFAYRGLQTQRAVRALAATKFDLVFVHTQTASVGIREMFPNATVVTSIDSTWYQTTNESRYARTPLFKPLHAVERRIIKTSDHLISWSQWAADSVINDYLTDPDKIRVVHHGISLPENRVARWEGADVRLGFVGNDFARKGGEALLRVHQEHFADRAHLTIVSSDRIDTRRLKNVTVRSHVPWDELMTTVMPTFDIFVLPAVFDYSPFAIVEARMLGLPVIAGRSGAIPEMIRDGIDGILVEDASDESLARAMTAMMANPALAREMGIRAKEHAEAEYSAHLNYPRLLDHLLEITAK